MANKNNDVEEVIETVTIIGDKGEHLEFVELLTVPYDGNNYVVLDPLQPIEGFDDGDVLIYRVDDGGKYHNVDDDTVSKVFDLFLEMVEEMDEE